MQNIFFENQYNEITNTVQYLYRLLYPSKSNFFPPARNVVDKVAMGQVFLQVL